MAVAPTAVARAHTQEVVKVTLVRRPSPFGEMLSLRDAMDRLFDESLFRPVRIGNGKHETIPALDVYTTPESVVVEAGLPGVKPEDIDVTIEGDTLKIDGKFEKETDRKDVGYFHRELSRGEFSRVVVLPAAVKADGATATFKDGLLKLVIPKAEETKTRHVRVSVK